KYEPPRKLLGDWPAWDRIKTRFFGYHRDLPPEIAARLLGGEIVFEKRLGGQWVAVVDLQKPEEAVVSGQWPAVSCQSVSQGDGVVAADVGQSWRKSELRRGIRRREARAANGCYNAKEWWE
ncbi:MAG TPA: hypothetical protein VF154_15090, partial [Terriglobales bacterium]